MAASYILAPFGTTRELLSHTGLTKEFLKCLTCYPSLQVIPQGIKDCSFDQLHSAVLETPHACKHNYFPTGIFGIVLWNLK